MMTSLIASNVVTEPGKTGSESVVNLQECCAVVDGRLPSGIPRYFRERKAPLTTVVDGNFCILLGFFEQKICLYHTKLELSFSIETFSTHFPAQETLDHSSEL